MPMLQAKKPIYAVSLLDDLIPLRDASHTDVVEYCVEVPFRYAECVALLADGRKVGLRNPRLFVGWSGKQQDRSLLFRINGAHLEVGVADEVSGQAPGKVHNITLEAFALRCAKSVRKFIGIDGELVYLPA